MKVKIELNESVFLENVKDMDDKVEIHLTRRDQHGEIVGGKCAIVNIDDLKLALRKMTAR